MPAVHISIISWTLPHQAFCMSSCQELHVRMHETMALLSDLGSIRGLIVSNAGLASEAQGYAARLEKAEKTAQQVIALPVAFVCVYSLSLHQAGVP